MVCLLSLLRVSLFDLWLVYLVYLSLGVFPLGLGSRFPVSRSQFSMSRPKCPNNHLLHIRYCPSWDIYMIQHPFNHITIGEKMRPCCYLLHLRMSDHFVFDIQVFCLIIARVVWVVYQLVLQDVENLCPCFDYVDVSRQGIRKNIWTLSWTFTSCFGHFPWSHDIESWNYISCHTGSKWKQWLSH